MHSKDLHFILYCRVGSQSIVSSLGAPEYSYYFVYRNFAPAFEAIGRTTTISDPETELKPLLAESEQRGEQCHFICFTPPNKSWVDLPCQTTCVFAWEFDTIPDTDINDDPMENWVQVLKNHGQTITLSSYSTEAVRNAIDHDYKAATIAVPLAAAQRITPLVRAAAEQATLHIDGSVIDSENYVIDDEVFSIISPSNAFKLPQWDGEEAVSLYLQQKRFGSAYLGGFYNPESWGAWSKTRSPWVLIPFTLHGDIRVDIHLLGHGDCVGSFKVSLGQQVRTLQISNQMQWHTLHFRADGGSSVLQFHELNPVQASRSVDVRMIGIGLKEIRISRQKDDDEGNSQQDTGDIALNNFDALSHFGFHPPEPWGAWSKEKEAGISLPQAVQGALTVEIQANGFGHNANRDIAVQLGEDIQILHLNAEIETHKLHFFSAHASKSIQFSKLDDRVFDADIDPRALGIGVHDLRISENQHPSAEQMPTDATMRKRIKLGGFYPGEDWGAWVRSERAFIVLPGHEQAVDALRLQVRSNTRYRVRFELGHQHHEVTVDGTNQTLDLPIQVTSFPAILSINSIDKLQAPNAQDPRPIGIGLEDIEYIVKAPDDPSKRLCDINGLKQVRFNGLVYTTVFNPADFRKNWVDMLTSFIHVFKDKADVTLIIKITHKDHEPFLGKLHFVLHTLQPYQCRVIALHGFLDDADFTTLIDSTHYYLNASLCEGLCLPLIEFMERGKPSVAPRHTAMLDFVRDDNAFIVEASKEPAIWPHDPREYLTTHSYRIDWWSLRQALDDSYQLFHNDNNKYQAMGIDAQQAVIDFCSPQVVEKQLQVFFEGQS